LVSWQACSVPAGYVRDDTDCDDIDSNVHPGAMEIPCNGKDDECQGGDSGTNCGSASSLLSPPQFAWMIPPRVPWYFNSPSGVAVDGSGNFYVADSDNNRIQKFDSNGTFLATWGSEGSGNGQFSWPRGIAVDVSGMVYVADRGNNRIQKFDSNGAFLATWGSYGPRAGQFDWPCGIAVDGSGMVYVADAGNHRIQKFDSNGAFWATWGSYGSGDGQFSWPRGIAVDVSGMVYVADTENHRIQKFDSNGALLATWVSSGSGDGQFDSPFGIAVDGSGNVYVADSWNHCIQVFDSKGAFLVTWGSYGSGAGQFDWPCGIAVDGSGMVYVADTYNNRIQKFDSKGTFLATWGSYGTGDGQFQYSSAIAVDVSGMVYVADAGNHRIQKFDSNGAFLATWGSYGSGAGQFQYPSAIAVDVSGMVYVADSNNHRIQVFDSKGAFLAKWGSYGSGAGQFRYPRGIAVDGSGNVYVADSDNHRIQKYDSKGTFLATWGSSGSGDGQFQYPSGIAVDVSGMVYVADRENDRMQKFDSKGAFLATWGSSGSGNGQFLWPSGIAVDGIGMVYVADSDNHRMQKFDSKGTFLATWGNYGSGDGQFSSPLGIAVDGSGAVYVADTYNNRIQKFTVELNGQGTSNSNIVSISGESAIIGIKEGESPASREVRVSIALDTSSDLFSLTFELWYDTSVLTATSLTRNSERVKVEPLPDSIDDTQGKVIVSLSDLTGSSAVKSGSGKILELTFKLDQPVLGSYPIEVRNIRNVFSTTGEEVKLASRNGEVTIRPAVCNADVDDDGDLNVFDLVYLNRYLQGLDILVPTAFRETNPAIPSDEVIMGRILENESNDCFDVDKINGFTIFDLVYINRLLQGISQIVPAAFRETNPNLAAMSDAELADKINSLKPQSLTLEKLAKSMRLRSDETLNPLDDLSGNNHAHDYESSDSTSDSTSDNNGNGLPVSRKVVGNTNSISFDSMSLTPGSTGSTISIPIRLDVDQDLFSATFDLIYDTSKLNAVSLVVADQGRVIKPPLPDSMNYAEGRVTINMLNMNGDAAVKAGQGKIVVITFEVEKDITEGDMSLEIKNVRNIYTTTGVEVPLSIENGRITIQMP